jgi:glycosyltransferase involved in cell wall biosynthesis
MIHIFMNALAATAGGGITYVRNAIPQLAQHSDVTVTIVAPPSMSSDLSAYSNVHYLETDAPDSTAKRFLYEQLRLPALIRKSGAQVLLSAGNFVVWNSPVPQILLSGNALYTSKEFLRDLRTRHDSTMLLDTQIKGMFAKASVRQAEVTVAPSEAFAQQLRNWVGGAASRRVISIHHGFDRATFHDASAPLPPDLALKLKRSPNTLRLLCVSHYNYYRNFETLLRALPLIQRQLPDRKLELLLTCSLTAPEHAGSFRANSAAQLKDELRLNDAVLELGSVPYSLLHHVYATADVYVTASYVETFAHPLVEAMSSGVPIVASDIAVHREICSDAALHYSWHSPQELADRVFQVVNSPGTRDAMIRKGTVRAGDFSWRRHVELLLDLATRLSEKPGRARETIAAETAGVR